MWEDFVCETATNPGTGAVTLLGANPAIPCMTFLQAGYATGDWVYYVITDGAAAGKSEHVLGQYDSSAGTLSRATTIKTNTGGTSALNFTGGVKVFCFAPASRQAYFDNNLDLSIQRGILFAGLPLLRGYLSGFTVSKHSGTVVGVTAGVCIDSTNTVPIALSAFTKNTGGTWVAGSSNAGMGTGLTIANSTWYHIFAIIRSGAYDMYFDTSVTAANAPSGTTAVRRLGSFLTDGSAAVTAFTHDGGDMWTWTDLLSTYSGSVGTSRITPTLGHVPPGVEVIAHIRGAFLHATAGTVFVLHSLFENYSTYISNITAATQVGGVGVCWGSALVRTTTGQQVAAFASAASGGVNLAVHAYFDPRGRY